MANPVTSPAEAGAIFQGHILANLEYWQTYIATNGDDVAALERGRSRIVKAILFGLEMDRAWPILRRMIETLSPYMERRGYWEIWHEVLTQAIRVAHTLADQPGLTLLYALRARLAQRQTDFKQTIADYRRTIHLARRCGDRYNEARACSNLGYLYTELGRWQRAEVLCCHALAIFEQLDSDHGRAHTENHLGILYSWQGRWDLARQHLENACALWQAMGDQHGLMRGLINLGRLCNDQECPDEALVYLEKALHQAKLTGEEIELASIYTNMGISRWLSGELTQATEYLRQSETIFRRHSNLVGLAEIHDNLGLVCIDQRQGAEAISYLETALKFWRQMSNKYGEARTLTYMVKYELARGARQHAMKRLNEVECFMELYPQDKRYYHLQETLQEYQHHLTLDQ